MVPHHCRTLLHLQCPPRAFALIIFIALLRSSSSSCHHAHHFLCTAAFIIFIAPPRSSSSSRCSAHHLHRAVLLITHSSSSSRHWAQLHLCAVALIFIVVLLCSSHHCTFDFLPSCSYLLSHPSRAHLHLLFCAVVHSSSLSRLPRTHLNGARRAPIIIVAPIACPSSSSHPSHVHLHVAPVAYPSSSSRPLPAHLLHLCTVAPFFILIAAPSRLSVALIFIFIAALSRLSSTLRHCAHLHGCAVAPISSLHHRALHLNCTVKRTSFIIVPSRTLFLSLLSRHRGCAHKFLFGRSLAAHLCMPALFPLSAVTVPKYSFDWHCSSLPCHHLFFFFMSSFMFALSHADLYCCIVAR